MINLVADDRKVLNILARYGAIRTKKLKCLHIPTFTSVKTKFWFWEWMSKDFRGNIYIRRNGFTWYLTIDNEFLLPCAETIGKDIDSNTNATVFIQLRTEASHDIDDFVYP